MMHALLHRRTDQKGKDDMKIPAALDNALQNHAEVNTIALHLDNDYAGKTASRSIADQLGERYMILNQPPMVGKDYNDYLMYIRQRNREKRMAATRYDRPR